MIINKIDFPIYGIIILCSLIIGIIFNYMYLRKNKIEKRIILLFSFMMLVYAIIGGILVDGIINKRLNSLSIGLSSYGGAIGVILSAIVFEKICPSKGILKKTAILSLPLIYSISKLACFFAGCCYGIPYNGIFGITYSSGLNIPLFPVQLAETIAFMLVFIVCIKNRENKNIIEITIILSSTAKFLLDFLRYSHIKEIISINQIISIVFVLIGIVLICIKNRKVKNNNIDI